MALQTSGAISLLDIQNEFGGSNPININEYYRGGAYVPNITQNNNVPTSGTISLSNFYGATAVVPLPIPFTNYMRSSTTLDAVYGTRTSTGAIVSSVAAYDVRLRRADPYVYLEIKEVSSPPTTYWYNTSGQTNTLSTSYVTMLRFNLTGITEIQLEWTVATSGSGSTTVTGSTFGGATFSATNGSWRAVSNGQSIGFRMQSNTFFAECYQSFNSTHIVQVWAHARKSGYLDTRLGRWRIRNRLFANSNNCL